MGEMGMSAQEFWDMPPALYFLKQKGYFNRENRQDLYFRRMFTLNYNHFQLLNMKNPEVISEQDVLLLPGEKKPRKSRNREPKLTYTDEQLSEIQERMVKARIEVELKQNGS
jgi:hypothetical protein